MSQKPGVKKRTFKGNKGLWFEGFRFQEVLEKEDPFLHFGELDLWEEDEGHSLEQVSQKCPDCDHYLFEVKYKDSKLSPWVCVGCKGIWVQENQFQALVKYLEEKLDEQSVVDLLKKLGDESIDVIEYEGIAEELKHAKMVFQLIEYRLASKFSLIEKLIGGLPKP